MNEIFSNKVIKIRLRGGRSTWLTTMLSREYKIVEMNELPPRWWQRRGTLELTVPYPGPIEYKRLKSNIIVWLGAFNTTNVHVFVIPADKNEGKN